MLLLENDQYSILSELLQPNLSLSLLFYGGNPCKQDLFHCNAHILSSSFHVLSFLIFLVVVFFYQQLFSFVFYFRRIIFYLSHFGIFGTYSAVHLSVLCFC